jgi:hypothetical protein
MAPPLPPAVLPAEITAHEPNLDSPDESGPRLPFETVETVLEFDKGELE